MKNYVISLKNAEQRRTHITKEFGKQNIAFEFFDAITPDQVANLAQRFDIHLQDGVLTQGELACMFSHLCLWQQLIESDEEFIAVFEDDVYLGENAAQFLDSSDWVPKACQLLKIEHFLDEMALGASIGTHHGRQIKPLKEFNWGTAGYILHRSMAQKLFDVLRQHFHQHNVPIDHLMFLHAILDYRLPVYQLTPALCVQSDRPNQAGELVSMLESERKANKKTSVKQPKSIAQKLIRELKRPFVQLSTLYKRGFATREKITFK